MDRGRARNKESVAAQVVENQLRDDWPPETRQAFLQLRSLGYSIDETKDRIASVVQSEIIDVLKRGRGHTEAGYRAALKRLPKKLGPRPSSC